MTRFLLQSARRAPLSPQGGASLSVPFLPLPYSSLSSVTLRELFAPRFPKKCYQLSLDVCCHDLVVSTGNARAIHSFTDHPVTVVAVNASPYFSPHPIPFFTQADALLAFLRQQPVIYGIVLKNSVKQLERLDPKQFKYECLDVIGNQYLVRIQTLPCFDKNVRDRNAETL